MWTSGSRRKCRYRHFELPSDAGLRLGTDVTKGEGCLGLGVNDDDIRVGIHYFCVGDRVATLGAETLAPPITAVARHT